eukprot:2899305-Amphidinium_carterae.1
MTSKTLSGYSYRLLMVLNLICDLFWRIQAEELPTGKMLWEVFSVAVTAAVHEAQSCSAAAITK